MRRLFVILALTLTAAGLFAVDTGAAVTVSVREVELRSGPGFLSAVQERLPYGQTVRVLEKRPGWVRVQIQDTTREGWIAESAVAPPAALRLSSSGNAGTTGGATSREIALAGRGFNQQIEAEYQEQEQIDFSGVDQMEGNLIPVAELIAFFDEIGGSIDTGGAE